MSTYNCRGAINGIIVQDNPVNWIDPDGLIKFKVSGNTVDIRLSGTFLVFNPTWDFSGFGKSNFELNGVLPPTFGGIGLDIKINPPEPCDRKKYISPFIGARHGSVGTNVTYNENTQKIELQGINISPGISYGLPFGVTIPIY